MHPYVIAELFTTENIWKQPKCLFIDKWKKKVTHMDKHIYVHICMCVFK